jgi:serine/threonine protein kinase
MGVEENNDRLYLLDFGLAKKYRSSRTLVQYPYIKKKKLTGTARYASIHALEAYEQSR